MNNRERGWPVDCRKCDLYNAENGRTARSADNGTPVCECMSHKRYEYLKRNDCVGGVTVDYNKLVEQLKEMLPKKVRYGELVGAPVPYNQMGDMVYEDPEPYIIEQAADAITELLARAETAEKENTQLKEDLGNWSYNCKTTVERAQQFKSERDAAVSDLRGCAIESCAECMYCLYRTARSFCSDWTDGSNWRWKGEKEDNHETIDL